VIDGEIARLIDEAHQRARDILTEHRGQLEEISQVLLRRETIERSEFLALLEGAPEAQVFAERDAKAAREAAERERAAAEGDGHGARRESRLSRPGEPLTDA